MKLKIDAMRLQTLRAYSAGILGTREAIESAGLQDYADLVIALVQSGLDFPKAGATPQGDARLAQARAILQPRLRHAI